MNKTLFVCYQHGCRGEGLSHRISQHSFFTELTANRINGRTVIIDDHFGKKFLMHKTRVDFMDLPLPADKNIVVPSHYFFDPLGKTYPKAKYIAIDVPRNLQEFKDSLYDRYFEYTTKNFLELMGECEDKFWPYNRQADDRDFEEFVREVLSIKDRNFGDIFCLAKGLEPTYENKKILLEEVCPAPLTKVTTENSFVIPYEEVNTISVDEIVEYMKK